MIERILLPTDGSTLSELAIAPATMIARAQGAEIVLVRVVEPLTWAGYDPTGHAAADVYQEMADTVEQQAQEGLDHLAARLRGEGVPVQVLRRFGQAAAMLLDAEAEFRPDLVVMASHGRTGLARFALGSVADVMVREGSAPVLIVHAFNPPREQLESALVPLDGSPVAEAALPLVEELAGQPLHTIRLLRAVARANEEEEAYRYLEGIRTRLAVNGSARTKVHLQTAVRIGKPTEAIEQEALATDLIILSTHGRGGLARLRHGSVADHVTRHVATPSLLVRPTRVQAVHAPTPVIAAASV